MDGVSLSHLTPGLTYDVPADLGHWLISQGVADYVPADSVALIVPLDDPLLYDQLTQGVTVTSPTAEAADTAPRRKRSDKA